jgi:hypothetical protein
VGSKDGFCIDWVAPVSTWIVGNGAVRDAFVGDGVRIFCGCWGENGARDMGAGGMMSWNLALTETKETNPSPLVGEA